MFFTTFFFNEEMRHFSLVVYCDSQSINSCRLKERQFTYHSTVIIMQEGHKLNMIRWEMCFMTTLCSCIIRNPVNEILLTKN
ncbi:unnamed protein product, partial [Vitis vinifera]